MSALAVLPGLSAGNPKKLLEQMRDVLRLKAL
jgi:hypothetical protein